MVKLDSVNLQRGGGKYLLEQTSAAIHPGQKVALIGANGCGKSSLLQLLLGQNDPLQPVGKHASILPDTGRSGFQ